MLGPARRLDAGLAQHPFAERNDEPDLLGERNELGRRHGAAVRTVPAQQRLAACDLLALGIDQRLVEHLELIASERLAQIELEAAPRLQLSIHLALEETITCTPVRLGAI